MLSTTVGEDLATKAAYYWLGLSSGFIPVTEATAWALSVIASEDEPPIEILEVAMHDEKYQVIENLRAASGKCDGALAGRWLFYKIKQALDSRLLSLADAAHFSVKVAEATIRSPSVCEEFKNIEDEIFREYCQYGEESQDLRETLGSLLGALGEAPRES